MRVFRATYRDRDGKARESRRWYLEFRDDRGIVRRLPGFTDKPLTLVLGRRVATLVGCRALREPPDCDLARWIEGLPRRTKSTLARWGLLDARRLAASKPLAEHLADFEAWLRTRGTTAKQVELVTGRAKRVVKGCGFTFWTDVSAAEVEHFLARSRAEGLPADGEERTRPINAQTSNFYLQAVKQLGRWMVREGRASESPLAHATMLNTRPDRRHVRRALSLEEAHTPTRRRTTRSRRSRASPTSPPPPSATPSAWPRERLRCDAVTWRIAWRNRPVAVGVRWTPMGPRAILEHARTTEAWQSGRSRRS